MNRVETEMTFNDRRLDLWVALALPPDGHASVVAAPTPWLATCETLGSGLRRGELNAAFAFFGGFADCYEQVADCYEQVGELSGVTETGQFGPV